jgi:hypothetical protein
MDPMHLITGINAPTPAGEISTSKADFQPSPQPTCYTEGKEAHEVVPRLSSEARRTQDIVAEEAVYFPFYVRPRPVKTPGKKPRPKGTSKTAPKSVKRRTRALTLPRYYDTTYCLVNHQTVPESLAETTLGGRIAPQAIWSAPCYYSRVLELMRRRAPARQSIQKPRTLSRSRSAG